MDSTTQRLMTSAGGPVDPFFENVTMLLHGDGTNGAQNNTFLDSSSNNFTITRNGNVTQGSLNPFGDRWSNYFDGSGDWLQTPSSSAFSIATSTTPFTIEAWIFPTATGGAIFSEIYASVGNLVTVTVTMSDGSLVQNTNGRYIAFGWFGGSTWTTAAMSSTQVSLNTWSHVAVVFTGATSKIYVNGTDVTKSSSPTPATSWGVTASNGDGCYIGRRWDTFADIYFTGYISNLRLVNGTAVYTAAFTPPAAPLTAITNTSLLTCQSNRFVDNSSNNFTITRNGDVSVQPFSPFAPSAAYSASVNGGSGYFDGTGDYLNFTGITLNGSFCLEAWYYRTGTPANGYSVIFGGSALTGDNNNQFVVYNNGSVSIALSSNVVVAASGTAAVANAWNHIAFVRSGSSLAIFVNGVRQGTGTSSINTSICSRIGDIAGTAGYLPIGYIASARIVVGSSVYDPSLTTLTVPTAPLTAITNTSLLLNFTNGGIIDNAADNVLETVGNAQISTSVKKYGTGSLAFDGVGDQLLGNTDPALAFGTGDFTIEAWVYQTQRNTLSDITSCHNYGVAADWLWSINSSGQLFFQISSSGTGAQTSSSAVSLNTWTHVAVTRQSGTVRQFIGGSQVSSATYATSIANTIRLSVGSATNLNASSTFYGHIDDLRITKGVARYTANFTPPSGPFPDM